MVKRLETTQHKTNQNQPKNSYKPISDKFCRLPVFANLRLGFTDVHSKIVARHTKSIHRH